MAKARKFKKVSADEARNARKDQIRSINGRDAVIKASKPPLTPANSWDPETRTARFVMTAQVEDRYGDIVVTEGIDTEEFQKNPVAPLCHNTYTWPVGQWGGLEKMLKTRPPRMEGDLILLPKGGPVPEVDQTAWMLENGVLRACSIGFLPAWDEIEMILDEEGHWTYGFQFNKSELLECSPCIIPANQEALIKMQAAGFGEIAKELIEDTLDNYDRSPSGVLVPRAELEKMMKSMNGHRSIVAVGKMVRKSGGFVDGKLEAKDDAEAKKFAGAKVNLAKTEENKPYIEMFGDREGTVIDAYMVDGVFAMAVEFYDEKEQVNGMLRGFKADHFVLAKPKQAELPVKAGEAKKDAPEAAADTSAEKETAVAADSGVQQGSEQSVTDEKIKEFLEKRVRKDSSLGFGTKIDVTIKDGAEVESTTHLMMVDGEILQLAGLSSDRKKMIIGEFEGIKQKLQQDSPIKVVPDLKLKLHLDTTEAESLLEKLTKSLSGLGEKVRVAFDGLTTRESETSETGRVPPKLKAEATAEEVIAAKAEAAEVLKRHAQAS